MSLNLNVNFDYKLLIILLLAMFSIVLFTLIVMELYTSFKKYEHHKKRVGQLELKKSGTDMSVEDTIENIAKFVNAYILKNKPSPNDDKIAIELKMVEWDRYFGVNEFKAFRVFMVLVGTGIGLLFSLASPAFGLIVGAILALAIPVFFKVETKSVSDKYLQGFPDVIIILQGYLNAGYPLNKAVEETIFFASKEWKPLLKKMVTDIELMSVDYALSELRTATNISEIQEFASLVKIAFEQGDVGSSFEDQAQRMLTIQEDLMLAKIASRRSLAIVAQAPTMLAVFVLIGVPAVKQVMTMGAGGLF